jgi:cystathionine beta-lyase family protein involved in aluminum resistance
MKTTPAFDAPRADIIQAIEMGDPQKLIAFVQGIQAASPIDASAVPEPWDMPGYTDQVIMAAGTFVGGASIELSADAPMRAPYYRVPARWPHLRPRKNRPDFRPGKDGVTCFWEAQAI